MIEQLKNGVNAMRMPVDDLLSHWAYMVMAALAWNLKAWYGMLVPDRERGLELVRMEFRRFLHAIILLPVQIVRTGRRIGKAPMRSQDDALPIQPRKNPPQNRLQVRFRPTLPPTRLF